MLRSFVRTLRGPSRDARMAYISRPLPRDLHDEEVLAALDIALAENPDPAYLVETLRPALRQVTGHDYEVLDRSSRDVTGAFVKELFMIRDGSVGLWPGYEARAYSLLATPEEREEARAAIAGEETAARGRKPGWEPPPPRPRTVAPPQPVIGDAIAGASRVQDAGPMDRDAAPTAPRPPASPGPTPPTPPAAQR